MRTVNQCLIQFVLAALLLPLSATAASGSPDATRAVTRTSSVVLWQPGDPGEKLFLKGRVMDTSGRPLSGAAVALRQTDGNGNYNEFRYRATLKASLHGTFSISTVLPGQYWGPKHIHFRVEHEGHHALYVRVLFKGDPHLDEARDGDFAIPLEEVHKDGERIFVGEVELILSRSVDN